MCRNCHKIYDYGHISINLDGELVMNDEITNFDLDFQVRQNEYLKVRITLLFIIIIFLKIINTIDLCENLLNDFCSIYQNY